MNTKRLGSHGPEISVVGYGAWEIGGDLWGPNPEIDELIAAMHAGFDAGITWVDTAEVYGKGNSEEIVGRAVAGRDDVMVFTKVAPAPNGSGFDPAGVRAGCEASLKRLGRDAIDLYQLHWPTNDVPLEETWGAMAELVDEGLVRFIGVSNFDRERIETCEAIRHVDSLQPQFSMLERAPLDDGLIAFCDVNGTGTIAYGPLAYGLLTGTLRADTEYAEGDWRGGGIGVGYYDRLFKPGVIEGNLAKVDAMRPIAERLGVSMAELALAWVAHHATGAIAGSRKAAHVTQNARAGDLTLSQNDVDEIAGILVG